MSHERRTCHVFTFAELENIMQKLTGDDTVSIEEVYPVLSMYSEEENICYDTDEILDLLGKHLKRNLSWAFPIYDAQEVYIIESQSMEHGLPELHSWEWIDENTFCANFGYRYDEDGDEYELTGEYQTDTGRWIFDKLYEDYHLHVHLEDHRNAMRQQMETILRQEGVAI